MCPPDSLLDAVHQPDAPPAEPAGMSAEMIYRRVAAAGTASGMHHAASRGEPGNAPHAALDERLRQDLAAKLADLGAQLEDSDKVRLIDHIVAVLARLTAEAGRQLRAAIPELIEDWPDSDCRALLEVLEIVDLPVDETLLRLLPLLTGDELMAVAAAPLVSGTARMIASRPRLSDGGGDALARASRTPAVQALLASTEAAVREATLDALIARETGHPEWSEPLVRAPALPPRAARALAGLVAHQMLAVLKSQPRISQDLRHELRRRLQHRLSGQLPHPSSEPSSQDTLEAAGRLKRAGALNEAVLTAAAQRGESRLVAAMLAIAAGVPILAVDRAVSLRSTKGLISLMWRAGFSMAPARSVQSLLARVPPDGLLLAGPKGEFPLSVEEMRWQLEFLSRVGR